MTEEYTVNELEMIDAQAVIMAKFEEISNEVPLHRTGTDLLSRSAQFLKSLQGSIADRDFDNTIGLGVLARLFR